MVSLLIQQDPALARRQKLAEAMLGKGMQTGPVSHWSQGLARVLNAGAGAYLGNKAAQEQDDKQAQQRKSLAEAISGTGMAADGIGPPQPLLNRIANVEDVNPEIIALLKLQQEIKPTRDPLADYRAKKEIDADLKRGSGDFEGTGIENQMLNIILNKAIPENDPRKILARQRLGREITTVTPEGTYIQPGYDLDSINPSKMDGQGDKRFVPKPATEGQAKKAEYYERMIDTEKRIESLGDYDPTEPIEQIKGLTNITASPEFQQYKQAQRDWSEARLRDVSGAVVTNEEIESDIKTFWPVLGDSKEVIAQKKMARKIATEAKKNGLVISRQKALEQAKEEKEPSIDPRLKSLREKYGL